MDINNTNWSEKQMEQRLSYLIDRDIYRKIFSEDIQIRRNTYGDILSTEHNIMDRSLGIDTEVMLSSQIKITAQEKMLQYSKIKYDALTLEFMNNTNDERNFGDYFHLKSQIYCFAYLNEDQSGFYKWIVCDTLQLMLFLTKIGLPELKQKYLRQNPPPCKSSFFSIPIRLLLDQKNIIIYKS